VRIGVGRQGGWRAWLPTAGDFERALAAQAGTAVVAPQIDAETRRGRDYVRVTVAMTVTAADVAEALATAWQAFLRAASSDAAGWDIMSATAQVRPAGAGPAIRIP
jgi:hypothetical protein